MAKLSNRLPSTGGSDERSEWFRGHFKAADDVIGMLEASGITMAGKSVADIGCGDGIIDLGLAVKGKPASLIGFDLNPVDTEKLIAEAKREAKIKKLPECLEFAISQPERIPAENCSFDLVVTWSAFEHVAEPQALLTEIRRVLKPDGALFLQLWPFYNSEHGTHLWQWFPEGFAQFTDSDEEIEARVSADPATDLGWGAMMLSEFRALNRITLDDLGVAITGAGLRVARIKLITNDCMIPAAAAGVPLSHLTIGGVQLLAVPA
ncbi:MAG: methyltransferase domain-containing protein [Solirubrobacterales bacterium]|nr:methyltransferase domain-containing protein [Solirubrobacterales bacterium]